MITKYEEFILEFKETDVDKSKLDKHKGHVAEYLRDHGKKFTFGILKMLFDEAIKAKKQRELKKGGYKFIHRLVPLIGAAFFPIFSLVGFILGNTRAVNKIIQPVMKDPGNDYPEFLKRLIMITMNVAEGDIRPILGDDQFYDAFVINDQTVKMIRKDVIAEFSIYLEERISNEDPDGEVPKSYIENELKNYLNNRFELTPPMQFEEGHLPK